MSILSKFFETRHKDNNQEQPNQGLVSLFSAQPQLPKPSTDSKKAQLKKELRTKKDMEESSIEQQFQDEQPEQVSRSKKKHKKNEHSSSIQKNEAVQKDSENNNKKKAKNKKQTNFNETTEKQEEANVNQEKQQPQDLQSTIFVGNVPLESTHKSIKKFFQKYGKLIKVWFRSIPVQQSKIPRKGLHILKKYQQGADSMNAYVKFEKKQQAESACQANGQLIGEKNIKVTLCNNFQIDYQTTIFIGNLPKKVKDQDLWDTFKPIGGIKSVRVIRNKSTMEGIGIGYVRFETKEQMQKAIKEFNGKTVGDRPMRIKKAVSKQRLEKKIRKTKERKEKKVSNGGKNFGKGSPSRIRNQNNGKQRNDSKFPEKTKKINKDFPQNNKDFKRFPDKNQHSRRHNSQYPQSNEIIRTKYGFKGKKIAFQ